MLVEKKLNNKNGGRIVQLVLSFRVIVFKGKILIMKIKI